MAQRGGGEPPPESLPPRCGRRIEEGVEARVERGRACPAPARRREIAIEIDVVLVGAPQPRHSVRVEHVHQGERAATRQQRRICEGGELDRGTGDGFHAVQPAGMQQHAPRSGRAETGDIDGQIFSAGSARVERERLERCPCGLRRRTEAAARRRVIGRKAGFRFQLQRFECADRGRHGPVFPSNLLTFTTIPAAGSWRTLPSARRPRLPIRFRQTSLSRRRARSYLSPP